MSWYVTKIEANGDGVPARIYHRNGGASGKVTRAWTHDLDGRGSCEVCNPPAAPATRKPNALDELRAYQKEAKG